MVLDGKGNLRFAVGAQSVKLLNCAPNGGKSRALSMVAVRRRVG